MTDAERAQEAAMWVVVLAGAVLAAARFATYVTTVQVTDLGPVTTLTWWATYAIGVGLVVVGLLGQRSARHASDSPAWLALLAGLLVLVVMPSTPTTAGLGLVFPTGF